MTRPEGREALERAHLLAEADRRLLARVPGRIEPDRDRVVALLDLMGDPQRAAPAVHLTGTNGKTTTARMVEALLAASGLRVGRYTSPHLQHVTERLVLDGRPVDPGRLLALLDEVEPLARLVDERSAVPVTYFELLTAMAFAAFADAPVEAQVVEVGMGGRWDATNVLDARVAVVLPVALDHPELGDEVAAVATEKAGIIHRGATAVLAVQEAEAARVLLERCAQVGARVLREGVEFGVEARRPGIGLQLVDLRGSTGVRYGEVPLTLLGEHQARNAAVALAAAESFLAAGESSEPLQDDLVREALGSVVSPGRLEVVRGSPTVVVDAAHNPAGARATAAAVAESFAFERLVGVVGVLGDKDVEGLLEALEPVLDAVVATRPDSPRALPAEEVADVAAGLYGDARVVGAVDDLAGALDLAAADAEDGAPSGGAGVLVVGSVVLAGQARALLVREEPGEAAGAADD